LCAARRRSRGLAVRSLPQQRRPSWQAVARECSVAEAGHNSSTPSNRRSSGTRFVARRESIEVPALREIIHGPWRAVGVLGVTQIVAWGVLFYPPVLMVPLIAIDRGWSPSFAISGFSVGLLAAACVAPYAGIMIDRYGGHCVMPLGSLL